MKTFCLFFFILIPSKIFSQWSWARSSGGNQHDISTSVAADAAGNVYISGYFYSPSVSVGASTLTNEGLGDLFIAKYNVMGVPQWAISAGGTDEEAANSITTDDAGNIWVTGFFQGDSVVLGNFTLMNTSPGTKDIFITKIDASGNVLAAKKAGGSADDFATGIAHSGNAIYITGSFESVTADFDALSLTNSSQSNTFIVKYDAIGNAGWAKNNIQGYTEDPRISADAKGNAYIMGSFNDSIAFSNLPPVYSNGFTGTDIYIAKFDSQGNGAWLTAAIGNDYEFAGGIAADTSGNCYITGYFYSDSVVFQGNTIYNSTSGADDYYVARYDVTGNNSWANNIQGGFCEGLAAAADLQGNGYVTGTFNYETIVFGNDTLYQDTSAGYFTEIFVTRYDRNGNVTRAVAVNGNHYDEAFGIAADNDGNIYISGDYLSDELTFGSQSVQNDTSDHSGDFFVAKLGSSCSANFYIEADSTQLHHYNIVNAGAGTGPLYYIWSWGDNTYDTIPYPSHVYADSGHYDICLTVIDSTGCLSTFCDSGFAALRNSSANAMVYMTVINPGITGIETLKIENKFRVYPNPAGSDFRIILPGITSFDLDIYNITGEKVISRKAAATDVIHHKLPAGMYFIKAAAQGIQYTEKLIIQ